MYTTATIAAAATASTSTYIGAKVPRYRPRFEASGAPSQGRWLPQPLGPPRRAPCTTPATLTVAPESDSSHAQEPGPLSPSMNRVCTDAPITSGERRTLRPGLPICSCAPFSLVEAMGLEPTTPCLQSRCSSQLSYVPDIDGSDLLEDSQTMLDSDQRGAAEIARAPVDVRRCQPARSVARLRPVDARNTFSVIFVRRHRRLGCSPDGSSSAANRSWSRVRISSVSGASPAPTSPFRCEHGTRQRSQVGRPSQSTSSVAIARLVRSPRWLRASPITRSSCQCEYRRRVALSGSRRCGTDDCASSRIRPSTTSSDGGGVGRPCTLLWHTELGQSIESVWSGERHIRTQLQPARRRGHGMDSQVQAARLRASF